MSDHRYLYLNAVNDTFELTKIAVSQYDFTSLLRNAHLPYSQCEATKEQNVTFLEYPFFVLTLLQLPRWCPSAC